MDKPIRTKKALLARIGRGPTAVQLIANTSLFRVSIPEDPDPNSGVWIALVPDVDYMVDAYAMVYARIGGENLSLTRAETDAVARFVARTMRMRRQRSPLPLARSSYKRRHGRDPVSRSH
jgi:hypothetical protein